MSSPSDARHDPAVDEEAAAWMARLNTRAVSAETLEAFRLWRKRPGRREAFAALERRWRDSAALADDPQIRALLNELAERPDARRERRRRLLTGGLSVAAIAGLGLLALVAWPSLGGKTYQTAVGEERLVQLADGTRVRLDTDSEIRVRFGWGRRDVALKRGQAFFAVAHDAAYPFIVQSGEMSVRAIGTQFDVRRTGGEVRVTLVEGRVEVRSPSHAAPGAAKSPEGRLLKPGETFVLAGTSAQVRPADLAHETAWTGGRIVFRDTPLSAAVAEINRYSRRKIVLDGSVLQSAPITGVFDSGDVEAFVSAICELRGLRPIEGQQGKTGDLVLAAAAG